MNFEEMMKMFQMMQAMSTVMQNWMKTEPKAEPKAEPKKDKKDMTAAERLDELEAMYTKQDEEDVLIKRIEALEKRAPKVTTEIPQPMGLDGILKGIIPEMMNGQPSDKKGEK